MIKLFHYFLFYSNTPPFAGVNVKINPITSMLKYIELVIMVLKRPI